MLRRARALLGALRRLQVSAEMPRALDNAIVLRQTFLLITAERGRDVAAIERLRQRCGIVGGFRYAGADMRARDERRIADQRHPTESQSRAGEIVDRLQQRLID